MNNIVSNEPKKDFVYDFFNEYLLKYVVEIENFNKKITLNQEDTSVMLAAGAIVSDPALYHESEVARASKIYDSIGFFSSIGLLIWNYNDKKYYINSSLLYQKAIEGKFKDTDTNTRKIISKKKS